MSTKQFTAKVFRWLHQVNADAKLPASAAKVAIRLSPDFNEEKGGMAWSACKTMADDIGKSESTVISAVRALHARGHLQVEWGQQGRGHSNRYWMIEKGQQADLFDDQKPQPAKVLETEKTLAFEAGKPQLSKRKPQLSKRKPLPAKETLSKTHRRTIEGDSSIAKHSPPRVRSARKKEATDESKNQGRNARAKADAESFAEFWAVYPRHVAKEPARKEFAKASKTTDPQVIIEAAKLYAVAERARIAREGKPECTKYPGNWLRDRRWEDPPPQGAVIDQSGNVVGFEQPRARERREQTPTEAAAELFAELEERDRKWREARHG